MFHYVARAIPGTLLFRTWEEGIALFDILIRAFPDAIGLCVMPDHIHILLPGPKFLPRLRRAMSGYARWRSHRRNDGIRGVWQRAPDPEPLADDQKEYRVVRYVHLNPCRKAMHSDPLAWPLSTYRDRMGLTAPAAVERADQPERMHKYTSSDPSCKVDGTPLPRVGHLDYDLLHIQAAVSSVTRTVVGDQSALVRRLTVQTAVAHGVIDRAGPTVVDVGKLVGLSRTQAYDIAVGTPRRDETIADPVLAACVRVVGDERFRALLPGDLVRLPGWGPYRGRR